MRVKQIFILAAFLLVFNQSNAQSAVAINYGHLGTNKASDFGNSIELNYAVGYDKFVYPSFELSLLSMKKYVINSETLVDHLYLGSFIGVNKLIKLQSFSVQLTAKIGLLYLMDYDEDKINNDGYLAGNKYLPEEVVYTLKPGVLFGYSLTEKLSIRLGAHYLMPFNEYFMYELNCGILINLN